MEEKRAKDDHSDNMIDERLTNLTKEELRALSDQLLAMGERDVNLVCETIVHEPDDTEYGDRWSEEAFDIFDDVMEKYISSLVGERDTSYLITIQTHRALYSFHPLVDKLNQSGEIGYMLSFAMTLTYEYQDHKPFCRTRIESHGGINDNDVRIYHPKEDPNATKTQLYANIRFYSLEEDSFMSKELINKSYTKINATREKLE